MWNVSDLYQCKNTEGAYFPLGDISYVGHMMSLHTVTNAAVLFSPWTATKREGLIVNLSLQAAYKHMAPFTIRT